MGGAIADQFTKVFKLDNSEKNTNHFRISAGFASVFGTPLAGALFALEVLYFSKISYKVLSYLFSSLWLTIQSNYGSKAHPLCHSYCPFLSSLLLWIIPISILFGLAAMLFPEVPIIGALIFKTIPYPPLRPFVGGIVLSAIYFTGRQNI
jgi:H+/Cl- antiporter ClcA